MDNPQNVLLMKVGFHGAEALDEIIARKQREELEFGFTYWGYGGTLCHPRKAVQPFAKRLAAEGQSLEVLFVTTTSPFESDLGSADQVSVDGLEWLPLTGPLVTASRHALVIKDLKPFETELDLSAYSIAVGPSAGKNLGDYFRFRVDKALATKLDSGTASEGRRIKVSFRAVLSDPFAISVRHSL